MEGDYMDNKRYCSNCDTNVNYTTKQELIKEEIKGIQFEYMASIAYCNECGEEIYMAELSDENIKKANEIYREMIGIIKINEIEEILTRYHIGADPLSKLLEWGDKTIVRYRQGLMPSKEYSDRLKKLYNPLEMKKVYDRNKAKLTCVASRKLDTKIREMLSLDVKKRESEIVAEDIIKYYLNKVDEESGEVITHLKLQKLLYYTQAWYMAYYREPLINDRFQAWIHGPVIPRIYEQFKWHGYNPIPKVSEIKLDIYNHVVMSILEMVWVVYGKYEAKYLERLTHSEDPWRFARADLREDDLSNIEIRNEDMLNYYISIKEKHNIVNVQDLDKYVSSFCFNN